MFAFPVSSAPAFSARPYSIVDNEEAPSSYSAFDACRTALAQLALVQQQEQRRQAEAAAFLAEQRRRQRQAAIEQAFQEERRILGDLATHRRAAIARKQRGREEDQQRKRLVEARRQRRQQVDLPSFLQFVLDFAPDTETVVVEQPPAEPAAVASTSSAPPAVPSHAAESAPAPAAAPSSPCPSTPIESRSTSSDEAASALQRHFRRHLARRKAITKLTSLVTSFESRQSASSRPPSFTFQSSPSPSSSPSPTPPLAFGAPNASFLAYEDFLVNLLSKVDAVESGGDRAIKGARKELVRKVEKELARLDAMKDRAWEEQTEKASQKEQEADVVEMSPTAEDAQASTPTPLTAHAVSTLSALAAPVSRPPSPAPSDSSATSSTLSVSSGSSALDAYLSEILRSAQKLGEEVARREEAEPVRD
ncbi:hypothetical protein JCM1841_003861 [Sporobolomyces salmonicolor]